MQEMREAGAENNIIFLKTRKYHFRTSKEPKTLKNSHSDQKSWRKNSAGENHEEHDRSATNRLAKGGGKMGRYMEYIVPSFLLPLTYKMNRTGGSNLKEKETETHTLSK